MAAYRALATSTAATVPANAPLKLGMNNDVEMTRAGYCYAARLASEAGRGLQRSGGSSSTKKGRPKRSPFLITDSRRRTATAALFAVRHPNILHLRRLAE